LSLDHNPLREIPAAIGPLPLESLYLNDTALEQLPTSIGQ